MCNYTIYTYVYNIKKGDRQRALEDRGDLHRTEVPYCYKTTMILP